MILNTIATLILHIIIIKKSLVRYNGSPIILTSYKKIPFMLINHHFSTLKKHSTNTIGIVSCYLENILIQRVINEFIFEYKEFFNRPVELVQKYLP
jgi:hypothetical protein